MTTLIGALVIVAAVAICIACIVKVRCMLDDLSGLPALNTKFTIGSKTDEKLALCPRCRGRASLLGGSCHRGDEILWSVAKIHCPYCHYELGMYSNKGTPPYHQVVRAWNKGRI